MRSGLVFILLISLLSSGCHAAPPANLPTAARATALTPPGGTQTASPVALVSATSPPETPTPTRTTTPTAAPQLSAEQCQAVLQTYLQTRRETDFRTSPKEEQSIWGNPAGWETAQVEAATRLLGGDAVEQIRNAVKELEARYGLAANRVVTAANDSWGLVITGPGGYYWAVDENGNFLNRQDGVDDPKMAGFKPIPNGPPGTRAVTIQKRGCTLRFYVDPITDKVVSVFNTLFGQNNTPGQLLGTEPSNREATQTSQAAIEQAQGTYIDSNYYIYAGITGEARITPVSCYSREVDPSQVPVPEKTIRFRNDVTASRNGISSQSLLIENLVVADCTMRRVEVTGQKGISSFYEVTLTFLYRKEDGTIGTLKVNSRGSAMMDGNFEKFTQRKFTFFPGDKVAIYLQTVPSGSPDVQRKWLEGGDLNWKVQLGEFASAPFSSAEIKRVMRERSSVVLNEAEVGLDSLRH
jgi:hypothetical protein